MMRAPKIMLACLAALAATPAAAQTAPGIITTHAEASRTLPNTVSEVSMGVEIHAADVPGATAQLAQRAQGLLDFLRAQHAGQVRTEQVDVSPETQAVPGKPARITGYTGRTSVSFRTTPALMPSLVAGCLDHGANALQSVAASPSEADRTAARQQLTGDAARAALAEAASVAQAVGERTAGIAEIDVEPPAAPIMPFRVLSMSRALPANTPIPAEPGTTELSVGVSVRVRIVPQS